MSTNAIIKIEGVSFAKVYKHWDGYPSATLPWLKAFNEKFTDERGNDPEYKFAQLLRSSAWSSDDFNLDDSTTTGWGVVSYDTNYGAEYEYFLKGDGTVEVIEV